MKFLMSGNLLRFSSFQKEIEVTAPTVEAGVAELITKCPQLKPVLLDGEGRFRKVHRLFLNENPLCQEELSHPVGTNDEVTILTAIAGG